MNPFIVEPEEDRIELEWTDRAGIPRPIWLRVRRELSSGEQRRMLKSITSVAQPMLRTRGQTADPEAKFEWTEYSTARMTAYIIDWSLAHDPDLQPSLPPSSDSYGKLKQDVFALIDTALDDHEQRMDATKKVTPGEPRLRAMSG